MIIELEQIGTFKDDSTLFAAAIQGSNRMVTLLETNNKELVLLWEQLYTGTITEDEYQVKSEEVSNLISEELNSIYDNFSLVQTEFSSKYSYELEEVEEE